MPTSTESSPIFGPLRSAEGAATVALRGLINDLGPERATEIVIDQEQKIAIGERIRGLRNASPQTNRSIAEYAGIGERAVAQWMRGGGISYENAEKVADLFEVEVQWLLSGREAGAGDGVSERLARIEGVLEKIRATQVELRSGQARVLEAVDHQQRPQQDQRSRRKRGGSGRAAAGN